MPKVIENLRGSIITCARRELVEGGYRTLSIRGVARECGIAVGTVYNYFASKEVLAAHVMLEDWLVRLARMRDRCERAGSVSDALTALYDGITEFSSVYRSVWANYTFSETAKSDYSLRHKQLVMQLAGCLKPVIDRECPGADESTDVLLAENLLICTGDSELTFEMLRRAAKRLLMQ